MARDEGWAEGAGWVYGRAGERAAEQNVHGDGQADGEAGDFVERAFGVYAVAKTTKTRKNVMTPSSSIACRRVKSGASAGVMAPRLRAPDGVGDDGGEQVGCGGGAEKLRDPVKEGLDGAEAFGDPEADGDGGIEMATGNVADGGDHDGDGEAVGEGEAEEGDAALSGGAEVLIGEDSPAAKKITAKVPKNSASNFWVRLYTRAPFEPGAILAERVES